MSAAASLHVPPSATSYEKDVLNRERQRVGDDVEYRLARTFRSCIEYKASIDLGAVSKGNPCRRGDCMAKAMAMFCGKRSDGIPKEVAEAPCKY